MNLNQEQWADFMAVQRDIAASLKRLERPLQPQLDIVIYGSDDPEIVREATRDAVRQIQQQMHVAFGGRVVIYANSKDKDKE